MAHSLIVLPDDSSKPIIDALHAAQATLRIRIFLFSDPTLLEAVIAAQHRGVRVQVMLNPARRDGKEENREVRTVLTTAGVEVMDSNPAFELTHQKSMIVDEKIGFVESLNWEPRDFTETRDYAVVTDDPNEVQEMSVAFDADWAREKFTPPPNSNLIWCPDNGRERIARFIDAAQRSLFLQNERYQDMVIIERLVRARARGVKVHVLARAPHTLKIDKLVEGVGGLRIMHDVGIKVHTLKGLRLHAKMLLADEERAIIGSINLAPGSFDTRRELAIETAEREVIRRLADTAARDWEASHKLDLTDAGLMADIERRTQGASSQLVLDADAAKTKKR